MVSILFTVALLLGGGISEGDSSRLRQAGLAEFQSGHYLKAEEFIRKAVDAAETTNDAFEAALGYSALGEIQHAERQFAEAEQNYRKAISLLGPHAERIHDAAMVWSDLTATLISEARYDDALAAAKEASKLAAKVKVDDPRLDAQILNSFGVIYYRQKKMDKAATSLVQAAAVPFTPSHPLDVDPWQILNNLGRVYQSIRQYDKAEDAYRRSLHLAEVRIGGTHPALGVVFVNLGSMYAAAGRYPEAEEAFQKSLAILEHSKRSYDSILLMRTLSGLGRTYLQANDLIRARDTLSRATEIARRRVLAAEMPEVLEILDTYAKVLERVSSFAEAQVLETEARRIRASLTYTVSATDAK
jgi:tetratricopeptide (TPR) repeat protein